MKKLIGTIVLITAILSFQTAPKKQVPAKPVTNTTAPATGIRVSIIRGQDVYLKQCLACHQANGSGVTMMNAPLAGAKAVIANDKAKLINIVLKGMKGVEIENEIYNNVMAPHPELTDQQIADALTYVRNSWKNKASAVLPSEVAAVRNAGKKKK